MAIKTVCAWDVGIKHLPFCIVEKWGDQFKIAENGWDIMNILDTDKQVCCALKKDHKVCGKKATLVGERNGVTQYYCKAHREAFAMHDSQYFEDLAVVCADGVCEHVGGKGNACGKKAKFAIDKVVYCTDHKKVVLRKLMAADEVKPIRKKKCTSMDLHFLAQRLYQKLDEHPQIERILAVDEILIENQPVFKNPTMKTMGTLLFAYFVMRGAKCVKHVSPANKMKVNEDESMEILTTTKKSDELYKLTKDLGIKFTRQLLVNDADNLAFLNGYKKKDDLCDSFLLAYYYLFQRAGAKN